MKPVLITLTISLIALCTFVKLSYKHATIQDNVDKSNNSNSKLKQNDVYKDKNGNQIMLTNQAPLDYEVE